MVGYSKLYLNEGKNTLGFMADKGFEEVRIGTSTDLASLSLSLTGGNRVNGITRGGRVTKQQI